MFTAEHWLQPKLGVYIMNSCKTSQQGWFSGKYAEVWGKKEKGGKEDNSFSAFWEKEVVCTCSLEDNSKHIHTKLCNEEGECKKNLYYFKSDRIKAENKLFKKEANL